MPFQMTFEGDTLEQLKQAIEHHRQALQALEEALLAELDSHRQEENGHHQGGLLSIKEVCEELGMGKSWVYQRLRSGEIPSIKLGGAVKVKRTDLDEFIENQPYRSFEKEEE
jgi:excisionase family DNA binding protein